MGELATRKSDRQRIKIGTCESMYYLRWDDIDRVEIDYDLREPGLSFRLPFPDEDDQLPGQYEAYNRGYRLLPYEDDGHTMAFEAGDTIAHPGIIQLHHSASGLLVNASCFHGLRLPEGSDELQTHWNGKDPYVWELIRVKNHPGAGLLPLISCRHCGSLFRSDWASVLPHVADQTLRDRLTAYAVEPLSTSTPNPS
jgi:hypothetical protein